MQIYDFKQQQQALEKKLEIISQKTANLPAEVSSLQKEQEDPAVWRDSVQVAEINRKLKVFTQKLSNIQKAKNLVTDLEVAIMLAEEIPEEYGEKEIIEIFNKADNALQQLWIETLLSGEYDAGSAIISFHSGAGGEEAQDWAQMLVRMYKRYCDEHDYKYTLLDSTAGDGAGIKSQTYLVEGAFAYGYLKTEKGVHRLVRLSPFDANNRRHTSFASLEVSPFVDKPTTSININPNDIKVDTYRSSGAGGQHVNKTESAIRITHLPTGIVVTCQNERSQIQNREMAMRVLMSKLMERELEAQEKVRLAKLAENKKIEWGSQIRSYVLHPYSLAKDHRTGYETANVQAVLDGDIQAFINEYLKEFNND